jgi:hypothetical protein
MRCSRLVTRGWVGPTALGMIFLGLAVATAVLFATGERG